MFLLASVMKVPAPSETTCREGVLAVEMLFAAPHVGTQPPWSLSPDVVSRTVHASPPEGLRPDAIARCPLLDAAIERWSV